MRHSGTGSGALKRHSPLIVAEIVFVAAAISSLVWGNSSEAVLPAANVLAALAPVIFEKMTGLRIPFGLQLLYALLLLGGPFLGSYLHLYAAWPQWDTVIHFYSGFVIALGAVFAFGIVEQWYHRVLPAWLEAVLIVSVSTFVAVLWEIAEFVSDLTIGTSAQVTNEDTMLDLIAGTVAPVIAAIAFLLFRHRGWFRFFARVLQQGHAEGRRLPAGASVHA